MHILTKGALTAMTLALDFAAGSAIDQLWDADWMGWKAREPSMATAAAARSEAHGHDPGRPQTGGGTCKPMELSVMVMEIDRMPSGAKPVPRHVCIKVLSAEPELSAQFEDLPALDLGN